MSRSCWQGGEAVEEDDEGRIKRIVFDITNQHFSFDIACWRAIFAPEALQMLTALAPSEGNFETKAFFRADGSVFQTVRDMVPTIPLPKDFSGDIFRGQYTFPDAAHVRVAGTLVPIEGLAYEVPVERMRDEVIVEATGTPRILIKMEDGRINQLISDEQLKQVRFAEDGKVSIEGDGLLHHRVRRSTVT